MPNFTREDMDATFPSMEAKRGRRQRGQRANWRMPEKQYNVVRKHEKADGAVLWLPVGTISFWEDGSAKLNMHAFPQSFHVFPREE